MNVKFCVGKLYEFDRYVGFLSLYGDYPECRKSHSHEGKHVNNKILATLDSTKPFMFLEEDVENGYIKILSMAGVGWIYLEYVAASNAKICRCDDA